MSAIKNGLFAFFLFLNTTTVHSSTLEELTSDGIKLYQSGQYAEAKNLFEKALEVSPNNPSILYNRGLAEYRLGQPGPAIASWRRALTYDPGLVDAKDSITFAFSKLERKEIPHQIMLLESVRESFLAWISLNQAMFIFAITLFPFLWSLVKWLGLRKQKIELEEPPPSYSGRLVLLSVLFLIGLATIVLKTWDHSQIRATILPKTLEVKTGPENEQATLFEIYEGLEVVVLQTKNDWCLIKYPGGRSGWVPSNTIAINR